MFKIEIRNNGPMVDYSEQLFETHKDAYKFLVQEKREKRIWADMRVVLA